MIFWEFNTPWTWYAPYRNALNFLNVWTVIIVFWNYCNANHLTEIFVSNFCFVYGAVRVCWIIKHRISDLNSDIRTVLFIITNILYFFIWWKWINESHLINLKLSIFCITFNRFKLATNLKLKRVNWYAIYFGRRILPMDCLWNKRINWRLIVIETLCFKFQNACILGDNAYK